MKISLSNLNTKNLATLSLRVITVSEKPAYESIVKDNPLLAILKEQYNVYETLYLKESYSGMGPEVAAADEKRDNPFRGSRSILEGYTLIDGFTYQADAKALYAVIEQVGVGLNRYSYSEETARMRKLIEEWDKAENVERIAHLNLTDIVAMMKTAQTEFETIFHAQAEANAALRETDSASSIRGTIEKALRNYFDMVSSMSALDVWKTLYSELNEIVKAATSSSISSKTTTATASATTTTTTTTEETK